MRTIQEMRDKHWSGVKTLWPAKRSKVAVQFCWEGFKINKDALNAAKWFSMHGEFNLANFHLTSAYAGGPENDAFWNQF